MEYTYRIRSNIQLLILLALPYLLWAQPGMSGFGHSVAQGMGQGIGQGMGQGIGQGMGGGAMTCTEPCAIGYTCAMVRHGNGPPSPGCISMQEAILLNQALQGGPSGPGTGFVQGVNQQQQQQQQQQTRFMPQQPQQNFNNFQQPPQSIPGVNFLGSNPPERRGFEDRFRSASGPVPLPGAWNPPGAFNAGGLPGQVAPPDFIDPSSGGAFSNNRFGGVDGGLTSGSTHGGSGLNLVGQNSGFNTNTNQGFGGSGQSTAWGGGFQGETQPSVNPSNTELVGQGEGRVSTIMEDSFGYYFIFYRQAQPAGIRVNITKEGLCTRFETSLRDNTLCVTACTSDDECRVNHKCCPTGCSLGCMPPFEESSTGGGQSQQPNPAAARVPAQTQVGAVEAMCRPCNSHMHCNSHDQFCTLSAYCNGIMVCRQNQR